MSHFSVAVIVEYDKVLKDGEVNKDIFSKYVFSMLTPYQENNMGDCPKEYLTFNDIESEYLERFENESTVSFYDKSNCSSGSKMSIENINILNKCKVGDIVNLSIIEKDGNSLIHYYEKGKKYKVFHFEDRDTLWIEVIGILPIDKSFYDENICFDGQITVKKIDPPVEISFKEKYKTFENFMSQYAGYMSRDIKFCKYGYWENPNAKWDSYVCGGRWSNLILLKSENEDKEERTFCCQIKDINFTGSKKDYDWHLRFWELCVDDAKPENESDRDILKQLFYTKKYYKDFYKDKETYAKSQSKFITHAVLKMENGKPIWHESGSMGWFGCSSATIEEHNNWNVNYYDKFFKDENPENIIVIIDCHI